MTFIPYVHCKVDENNSTTTVLSANSTYTGTAVDVSSYESIVLSVYADQASSDNGLQINYSVDGTNGSWQTFITLSVPATSFITKSYPVTAKFLQIVYTNGATTQGTFRLQTLLKLAGSSQIENCSIVSQCNSKTGTILKNVTWTGTWEDSSQSAQIITNFQSNKEGTFSLDFSSSGIGNPDITYGPYNLKASVDCNQMFAPVRKYFRINFTNTDTSNTATVNIETRLLSSTSILYNNLTDVMDINTSCMSNRSVPFGQNDNGLNYSQIGSNNLGGMKVAVTEPLSAFGEMLMVNPYPMCQIDFVYGIANPDMVTLTNTGNGSNTLANQMLTLTSGSNGSSYMRSVRQILYKAGQGALARFSAKFTIGVASTSQYAGVGTLTNGYFFGYNGASFGVLHRQGGTDTWTSQTNWNIDKMDGSKNSNNKSGHTLDKTKGNVYQIKYQYLGFGVIKFFVETPDTNGFICVHSINYPNSNTVPNLTNPSMPLFFGANSSVGSSVSVSTASGALFLEGKPELLGPKYGLDNTVNNVTTLNNILTLHCKSTLNSLTNYGQVILKNISVACSNNSQAGIITLQVIKNGTLTGTPSYTSVDAPHSITEYGHNTTITAGSGTTVFNTSITSNNSQYIDVTDFNIFINAGDTLTFAAKSSVSTSVGVSICWSEEL
jgi:hypothetical protein